MSDRQLLRVKEFSRKHDWPEGSLRYLIYNAFPRKLSDGSIQPGNGFAPAIRKVHMTPGKRPTVFIDEPKFFEIVDEDHARQLEAIGS